MIRCIVLIITLFFLSLCVSAQSEYDTEETQYFPPPPNAASLGKYGEVPVNEFNGTANVSIPLCTIQEGDLSLSLSLNYHTGGIKVAEVSSWVGLGWALSAGGTITRRVNGTIDEGGYSVNNVESTGWYESGNAFVNERDSLNDLNLANCTPTSSGLTVNQLQQLNVMNYQLSSGVHDSKPDIFYMNLPGYSGKFYFNENKQVILDPYDNVEVTPFYTATLPSGDYSKFTCFRVTLPDGSKYWFGGTQATGQNTNALDRSFTVPYGGDPGAGDELVNSWHLVKMESVNGDYVIDFNYGKQSFNDFSRTGRSVFCEGNSYVPLSLTSGTECQTYTRTLTEEAKLLSIQSAHHEINFITKNEDRKDFWYHSFYSPIDIFPDYGRPKMLEKIEMKTNDVCVKEFELNSTYFPKAALAEPTFTSCYNTFDVTFDRERPRLNSIVQKSCGDEDDLVHSFNYYDQRIMPSRLSYKQDMWGYYTDNAGLNLLPDLRVVNSAIMQHDPSFSLAGNNFWDQETEDRNPNENYARSFSLSSVEYPTGAQTIILPESNRIVKTNTIETESTQLHQSSNSSNVCPNDNQVSLNNISFNQLITSNGNNRTYFDLKVHLQSSTDNSCVPSSLDVLLANMQVKKVVGGQEIEVFSESFSFPNEPNEKLIARYSIGIDLPFELPLKSACWWEEGAQYNIYVSKGFDEADPGFANYPLDISVSIDRKTIQLSSQTEHLVGGLRVKQITEQDGDNNYVTKYDYKDAMGVESGMVLDFPKFVNKVRYTFNTECEAESPFEDKSYPVPGCGNAEKFATHQFRSAPVFLLASSSGHTIGYKNVTKTRGQSGGAGHTTSEYNVDCISLNSQSSPRSWLVEQGEIPIFPLESRLLGKMVHQKVFAEGASTPIAETKMEYEEREQPNTGSLEFSQYFPIFRCPGSTNGVIKYLERIPNRYVLLKSKRETLDGLETITNYEYRVDQKHIYPIKNITSRGGAVQQTVFNYYPHDILDHSDPDMSAALMQSMVDRNMVGVKVKSHESGLKRAGFKNVLQVQSGTNRILPYKSFALERTAWVEQSRLFYDNADQFPDRLKSKFYQNDIQLNWNTPFSSNDGGLLESQTIINQTTSFLYNPNRLLSRRTNLDDTKTAYQYDGFWRLQKMIELGASGSTKAEVNYQYNIDYSGADNHILHSLIYPDGKSLITKQHFRPSGLALKTERLGYGPNQEDIVTETFTYDEYKRQAAVDNYQTGLTSYQYFPDPLSRLQSETYVDGSSKSFSYTSDGALYASGEVVDENGNTSRTFTDLLGRTVTSSRAVDGQFATTQYDYFDFGALEKVLSPEGHAYDYTYDNLGRMITKKIPGQGISSFGYDALYRLIFSTDPNNITQNFTYDAYNRPTQTTVNGTVVMSNQYDKQSSGIYFGKLWKTTEKILDNTGYGADLDSEWEFDEFGRAILERIDNHVGGQDINSNTFDLADNLLTSNKFHNGFEAINFNSTNVYDHSFRLMDEYIKVGVDPEVHITSNNYNSKDQLFLMNMRGKTGSILQSVNYQYNTRGWLTHINDVNEQGLPLVKCDDSNPPCDPCDPNTPFRMSAQLGSQTQFTILDVQGGGGMSMSLDYPYRETEMTRLKMDLENWLQANTFPYETVTANWSNGELTIEIDSSEFEFNKVKIVEGDGTAQTFYFAIDNAADFFDDPDDYCGICHQFGYECAACPIWEILKTCPTCPQVTFNANESEACSACLAVGESDCTACWIGGYGVRPLNVKIYLDPNALVAGDDHLLAYEASSLILLADDFSTPIYPSGNILFGDAFLAVAPTNPLTIGINLPAYIIAKDNQATLQLEFEKTILAELDSTFVDLGLAEKIGTQKLPELASKLSEALMESMAPFAKGPIGGMNPPPVSSSPIVDLFGMVLNYQDGHAVSGAPGQYNGNISGMTWQAPGERKQTYGMIYDGLDRIKRSFYYDWTINNTWNQDQKFATTYSYDLEGNILQLGRNGALDPCRSPGREPAEGYNYGSIDALYYIYNSQNQLSAVADASSPLRGFKNGNASYGYDGAGNLISDSGKNLSVQYNFLNLPGTMNFATGNMQLKYTSSGAKLQKKIVGGEAAETIDYVGNIEYKDGELAAIHHSQGRLLPGRRGGIYRYQYHLKDHLGNTRVLFEDINQDGTISKLDKSVTGNSYIADLDEVLGIYQYYPFGMKHDGVWTDETWDNVSKGRKFDYQYNGKELNAEFGLGWNDYGARWYDASIGRWNAVDPLAQAYQSYSPYNYTLNNPIKNIDPDGRLVLSGGYQSSNGAYNSIEDTQKEEVERAKNKDEQKGLTVSVNSGDIATISYEGNVSRGILDKIQSSIDDLNEIVFELISDQKIDDSNSNSISIHMNLPFTSRSDDILAYYGRGARRKMLERIENLSPELKLGLKEFLGTAPNTRSSVPNINLGDAERLFIQSKQSILDLNFKFNSNIRVKINAIRSRCNQGANGCNHHPPMGMGSSFLKFTAYYLRA